MCHFSDQECILIYRNEIHKLQENQWGQRKKQWEINVIKKALCCYLEAYFRPKLIVGETIATNQLLTKWKKKWCATYQIRHCDDYGNEIQ